jgi:hypothetical protein
MLAGGFGLVSVMGLLSGSMAGGLQAGCFGILAFLFTFFALGYAAACLTDIVENTAHNLDKAENWPDPDWRDRVWYMLRVGLLIGLAALIGTIVGGLSSLAADLFWPIVLLAVFLLFPILLLSALESASIFWPVSPPVWQSLLTAWRAWLTFYLLAAALLAAWLALAAALFAYSNLLAALIAGPLWAAAFFSYARLLGRLACWIMLEEKRSVESNRLG